MGFGVCTRLVTSGLVYSPITPSSGFGPGVSLLPGPAKVSKSDRWVLVRSDLFQSVELALIRLYENDQQ